MLITTTIGIPPDTYEKTVRHKVNRSKVCREALVKECERLEKEAGEPAAKLSLRPVIAPLKASDYCQERDI